jgi:hypothetical protein
MDDAVLILIAPDRNDCNTERKSENHETLNVDQNRRGKRHNHESHEWNEWGKDPFNHGFHGGHG